MQLDWTQFKETVISMQKNGGEFMMPAVYNTERK